MSNLLERADEALPITEMSRSSKKIIDDFHNGEKSKYVVMRNNIPAAVIMSVQYYEDLMDLIDDLKVEITASQRLRNTESNLLISHEDMLKRFEKNQ